MKRKRKYKQGIFNPIYENKYNGQKPIIFRSSLELIFMKWCDSNPNILEWGSESIVVPYMSPIDNRLHRYFVDNNITLKDKEGKLHKYLVEIKPSNQIAAPKQTKNKKASTLLKEQYRWAINSSKFKAATQFAKKYGYKFIIITEKDLKKSKNHK